MNKDMFVVLSYCSDGSEIQLDFIPANQDAYRDLIQNIVKKLELSKKVMVYRIFSLEHEPEFLY